MRQYQDNNSNVLTRLRQQVAEHKLPFSMGSRHWEFNGNGLLLPQQGCPPGSGEALNAAVQQRAFQQMRRAEAIA